MPAWRRALIIAVFAFAALPAAASAAPSGNHGRALAASIGAANHVPAAQGPVASNTSNSTNWSGYVSCFDSTKSPAAACDDTFTSATGTFVVPAAICTGLKGQQEAIASPWVGLDGWWSGTVEQTGVDIICVGQTAYYIPWYEFYPARTNTINETVHAGDTITATVTQSGGTVTTSLSDSTQGWSDQGGSTSASGLQFNSAEWIVESPTNRLTDFGTLSFSGASATDTSAYTGPIDDPTWGSDSIEMDSKKGGPFHYTVLAAPGSLSSSSTSSSFNDIWMPSV